MNCITTSLITALTRSDTINRTTREKNKQQNKQKEQIFLAKFQLLNLKAPSNNVKIQSEETLATQSNFFVSIKQMGLCINETR